MSGELNRSDRGAEMASLTEAITEVEFLAGTLNRFKILNQLRDSHCSPADLKQKLKIPQTTLRRNLIELEEKNWIESVPTEHTYCLTPAGELIIDKFCEMLKQVQCANRIGAFYSRLPETIPASIECLRSCSITCVKTYDPYNPVDKFIGLLESTTSFRGYAPILNPRYIERFADHDTEKEVEREFELITTPRMINILHTNQPTNTRMFLVNGGGKLLISTELPDFGVCIMDDRVVIFVYDRNQRIYSLLEVTNDYKDLVDWAKQQYDIRRQKAVEYTYGE